MDLIGRYLYRGYLGRFSYGTVSCGTGTGLLPESEKSAAEMWNRMKERNFVYVGSVPYVPVPTGYGYRVQCKIIGSST